MQQKLSLVCISVLFTLVANAQGPLTTNIYSELLLGTFEQPGAPNGDFCYSVIHSYSLGAIYGSLPGMHAFMRVDSVRGNSGQVSVSIGNQSGYVQLQDGLEFPCDDPAYSLKMRYYFIDSDTVYYSLLLRGTPLAAGLPYYPVFEKNLWSWPSNLCDAPSYYHSAAGDSVFVEEGDLPLIGPDCASSAVMQQGHNWYTATSAQLLTGDVPPCWYIDGSEYHTSWYSFTTPDEESSLLIQAIPLYPYFIQDVNLVGVQMGLYDACGGNLLSCAGSEEWYDFSSLQIPCATLSPNTTYYLLVGGLTVAGSMQQNFASIYYTESPCTVAGCTDPLSCNYNPLANTDNGSCLFGTSCPDPVPLPIMNIQSCYEFIFESPFPMEGGYYTMNGYLGNPMFLENGIFQYASEEVGEHTICFTNYSPSGQIYQACTTVEIAESCFEGCLSGYTIEDGIEPCTYQFIAEINSAFDPELVIWNFPALGQSFSGAEAVVTFPANGQYEFSVFGNDSSSCQTMIYYDNLIVTNCTGSLIYGCIDNAALNYDPGANVDDGSCIYEQCELSITAMADTINGAVLLIIPSVSPSQAVYIEWHWGDGSFSTEQYPSHNYADEGPFELCVFMVYQLSDSSYCEIEACITVDGSMVEGSGLTGGFTIEVQDPAALSVAEVDNLSFQIWPNPAQSILHYRSTEILAGVRILDIQGRALIHISEPHMEGSADLHNLAPGTYLLEGLSQERHVVHRFVVQH